MEHNTNPLAQLTLIKRRKLSEQERKILDSFALAMQPDDPFGPAEAALRLDHFCPPLHQEQEARDYIWMIWQVMLDIAGSPDVDEEIQARLVAVLEELQQCAKGELGRERVWRDLTSLPVCFEASYDDPTDEYSEFTTEKAQIWHKRSLFGARAVAGHVLGPYLELMYAIQSALEHDLSTLNTTEKAEWRVKVACAWLSRGAAKPLLRWAQENLDDGNVESQTNVIKPGPLYDGPRFMCFERWRFWQFRLHEFAMEESGFSGETRQAAVEALQVMWEAEERLTKLLS